MTKKEEQARDEQIAAMSRVDPFEHGYAPGTMVSVRGELIIAVMQVLGSIAQSERKEFVEVTAFKVGEQALENDPKVIRVLTTQLGAEAENVFNATLDAHYANIEAGITITQGDEPKLDMGNAPKG